MVTPRMTLTAAGSPWTENGHEKALDVHVILALFEITVDDDLAQPDSSQEHSNNSNVSQQSAPQSPARLQFIESTRQAWRDRVSAEDNEPNKASRVAMIQTGPTVDEPEAGEEFLDEQPETEETIDLSQFSDLEIMISRHDHIVNNTICEVTDLTRPPAGFS